MLAVAAGLWIGGGAGAAQESEPDVRAFTGVTLVDLRNGQLHHDHTVVWDRSRIVAAGPGAVVRVPAGARVIPAGGRFLIPGLWDMHVHIREGADAAAGELALPLFLVNGVTGVRNMSGAGQGEIEALEYAIRAGTRVGPRIVASGSVAINGPGTARPGWPDFFDAATPEQARKLVRFLHDERKVDFIKVYSGIPADAYFAMMDEARRFGMIVAGHKPLAVSFVEAADAGQKSMEHAREILLDSFPGAGELQDNPTERNLPPSRLNEILAAHDPRMLQEIFTAMVRNEAYYVPTHLTRLFDWKATADDRAYLDDPRLELLTPAAVENAWRDVALTRARARRGPEDARIYEAFFLKGLEATRLAHQAGVKVMVGTDSGDSWCFPGSGLHDEMGLLAQAGLSPLDILQAAIVTPTEYVGRTAEFGAIAPGHVADLVLLDENPLEDIRNARKIQTVVFNGRVFDRAALDRLQEEVAAKAKAMRAAAGK